MPEDVDLKIEQALSSCRAGRGRTVLFTGPAGRGTSRRLSRAADLARGRGMHVAVATGRPAERSLAFSVAVELFEPLWRSAGPSASRAELAAGAARAAVRLLDCPGPPSPLDDGGYAVTRGMWVLARRLAQQPLPPASDLPTQRASDLPTQRASDLPTQRASDLPTQRASDPPPQPASDPPAHAAPRPRGLAVIVDDLHDVDAPTLGLLAYAAARLDVSPVVILAGRRLDIEPCAPAAIAALTRAATVVVPEPLDRRAGAALVSELLPGASAGFAGACVAACGGNAALLHAHVVGLAAYGMSGSEAEADRVGVLVPDGTAAFVAERLSRLQAPTRALLHAVATSDRAIALEHAAAVAGLPIDAALEAFDALVEADVLLAEPPPAFAQPIVRLAVRASLTPGQRARLAPPADEPPGVESEHLAMLTPSEGRVAGLAASGMTTRQIAETLFVTPKTVEFHLRNVYAKLEIPSTRGALARVLGAADPVRSAG